MKGRFIHSSGRYIDPEGDLSLVERAKALDNYLCAFYGDSWQAIKDGLTAKPETAEQTKDFWEFFLLAIPAAKEASANDSSSLALPQALSKPIRRLASIVRPKDSINLVVVAGHPAIAEDLSTAWHPAWQDSQVEAAEEVTVEELSQVESALRLIEASSIRATSLVDEVCAAVCLLRSNGTTNRGSCISLTSKFVPGLIYFTSSPVIMTSESIVHESAHLWLSRFESAGDLYIDANRRVASPLRPDSRPVSGLMHQVWVLSNLVSFYRDLSLLDSPLINANYEKLAKRMAQHSTDFTAGLATMADNENALTDRGRDFVRSLNYRNN